MKYLLSKLLRTEDAVKFICKHDEDGVFVSEHLLEGFIHAMVLQKVWLAVKAGVPKPDTKDLWNGIAKECLIDNADAIVCYPDDAKEYGCFGKKIITVENSEA